MFANQAAWLIRNASGAVHTTASSKRIAPGDLVIAGSEGVAIGPADPEPIEAGLSWLRTTGSTNVLIWSATANPGVDLHLLARGCRDSFRPLWMRRNLTAPLPFPGVDADVEISLATRRDRIALSAARDVPYVAESRIEHILDLATSPEQPRQVWILLARRRRLFGEPSIVGVAILHLSSHGTSSIGALYNLGVDPAWRGRGIGSALTAGICCIARDAGATAILLNATPDGERIYRQQDFVDIGAGQTWYLPATVFREPPSSHGVESAIMIGKGEAEHLDPSVARWPHLPNGDSPIAFAARFEQQGSAAWLIANGADLDVVALWKLGLREAAIEAAVDSRWRNAQRGSEMTTPLHEAVRMNDADLVRVLIDAGADLQVRDTQWQGRALEWANALGRSDLADMIQQDM